MTSQAVSIANQINKMSDYEIDYLWDFLRKRRNESLLNTIDIKLEESMQSKTLSDDEAAARMKKLGVA
ncbi:MAG: hypothetical protein LBG82_00395 [Clostridiales Family XIII bacterium]|nr:hypothetical protein [Clostridiales Family XIII bacterium]